MQLCLNMVKKPALFDDTIILIAQKLQDYTYAIRGTASLVLQGFDMNVDDIDILCSKETAEAVNFIFKDTLIDSVAYKESTKFKSYFGKFVINNIICEVMGLWQINGKAGWSTCFDASDREFITYKGNGIYVTSVELELKFFALMQRWNAYHKLKKQVDVHNSGQFTLL